MGALVEQSRPLASPTVPRTAGWMSEETDMRATNGPARTGKRNKILKRAKGFWGRRHSQYKVACQSVMRAERHAFVGRKLKKREFRSLWITRVNIASRELGLPYSRLMAALQKLDVRLDRKQLSEMAMHQPEAFAQLVERAKAAIGG